MRELSILMVVDPGFKDALWDNSSDKFLPKTVYIAKLFSSY